MSYCKLTATPSPSIIPITVTIQYAKPNESVLERQQTKTLASRAVFDSALTRNNNDSKREPIN